MENWAFAAPPHHPVVCRWRDELRRAIVMGFSAYKAHHLATLGPHPVQRHMPYLTMHGAYVKVHDSGRVHMTPACDGPFGYVCHHWRAAGKWGERAAIARLFVAPAPHPCYPLLKWTASARGVALACAFFLPTRSTSFAATRLGLRPGWGTGLPMLGATVAAVLCCLVAVRLTVGRE